jgi:hypothetical protein
MTDPSDIPPEPPDSSSSFRILFESGPGHATHPCRLCGCFFETQDLEVKAYLGNALIGRVCLECLRAGPRRLSGRIKEHVSSLRNEALLLESIQRKCRQGNLQMPSFEDWQERNQLEDSLHLETMDDSP